MRKTVINIHVSPWFVRLSSIVVLLTMVIILTLPVTINSKLMLTASGLIYSYLIFRKFIWLSVPQAIIGLVHTGGEWLLQDATGLHPVHLGRESTVTAWVSVLRFRQANGRSQSMVIWRDAVTGDNYRRLLVLLRTSTAYQATHSRRLVHQLTTSAYI